MLKLRQTFSQITKQQIINSSYQQLVERIARTYNLKEYKNESGLCLLEMHHQFKLFNPGDWVLDVGASKQYAWTDLALKLTLNQQMTHKVISNDILDLKKQRQNNVFIRGDINEEPVQTKIGLELQNRNLDTILVDVSPPYTGNVNHDGRSIMATIGSTLDFASTFLKKGGNFVCKVLESQAEPLLDESFSIHFNEKYKYVPTIVRKSSPVCFYVMKGFLMSENYYALREFLDNYKGTAQKKTKLVDKYRGKYCWDPVKHIKKYMLDQIMQMRLQGRPQKQIIQIFANDPYVKVQKILKLLKQADEAKRQRKMIEYHKIMNQISEGSLFKTAAQMPETFEQFYEGVLQTMDSMVKEDKQKKLAKRQKISRAPLKQNQTYMKAEDKVNERQQVEKVYVEADLMGKYSERIKDQQIDLQMQKIIKIHPEVNRIVDDLQKASKDSSDNTIQQILQQSKKRFQQLNEQELRNVHEAVEESIRQMSVEDLKEQERLEKQVYRNDIEEQRVEKSDRYINQRRSKRKTPLY